MPDIFINTERPVDRSIVAGLNQPQREAAASAWVAGSSYDVNLYFVQNDGTYDAASGQAGQTVELAIAPVSEPESGTFTLTDGTDTTAALSFGASGQDVEDALNALNSDTGPNLGTASLVDVEKVSDTQYAITFRTLGAMTALSGASVSLYPESTVTGSIAVTGSGTQYAQQVIEVVRQPAIYQPTWSTITNGFNATVALNTTRLLQAMVLERGEPFFLEIRLNGTTVAREVVTVEESNMPASAFSGTAIASVLDAFAADPTTNPYFDADAWSAVLSIAAGNGDVVGPASAVDSNFAAFDGTTGKLIKDALVSAASFATAAQGALADSASQPGHTHTASDVTDFDTEVSNNTDVAANTAARHDAVTIAASGGRDYVTISGTQQLTLHQVDLTADVSGLLPTGNIADDAVTYAKIQNAVGNNVILGNNAGAGSVVDELTAAEVRAIINVEDGADVTDTANVTAAGALMDSEVDADIKTLSLPANTTISTFGASLVDDADAATARTTLGVDAAGTDNSVEVISIACSDETSDLTTGTAKATFRMPFAMTLTAVRASVTTAPTGSTLIVDINEGGSTIMTTNKLSIDATEKTSTTAATAPGITDSALADDAEITVDIDQVGSTVAGAGLKIYLIGTRT